MRGIIIDNLLDIETLTKKCKTEKAARKEADALIVGLCKRYKIDVKDGRFALVGFEF